MRTNVTTATVLDTRRARKDGTYPVKLRVTYLRDQKYYATGVSLTESDYEKILSPKPRGDLKETKILLFAIENKAIDIVNRLDDFNFCLFEHHFLINKAQRIDAYSAFETRIQNLKNDGKIGTATTYQNSMKSLQSYKQKLTYKMVTPEFLNGYEQWMIKTGNSFTTISMYLRCLRALINEAIMKGDFRQEQYPFGKHKYVIPASRNIKKALSIKEIEKIFNYIAIANSTEERSRDFWIFSYLCNGVNIKDIAYLKYKNIINDTIIFVRSKTMNSTKHNQKPIAAIITEEIRLIIEKWGNKPIEPEKYIFPILTDNLTPEKEYKTVKQTVKTINKYMRKIAKCLGIEKAITTYTARHSFSTVLKRSGASIEFISESLGHSDIRTTESYLDSFEDDIKRKYSSMLTDFTKK